MLVTPDLDKKDLEVQLIVRCVNNFVQAYGLLHSTASAIVSDFETGRTRSTNIRIELGDGYRISFNRDHIIHMSILPTPEKK